MESYGLFIVVKCRVCVTKENDQDDKNEDEDNTGAAFSVIVDSQSYDQ